MKTTSNKTEIIAVGDKFTYDETSKTINSVDGFYAPFNNKLIPSNDNPFQLITATYPNGEDQKKGTVVKSITKDQDNNIYMSGYTSGIVDTKYSPSGNTVLSSYSLRFFDYGIYYNAVPKMFVQEEINNDEKIFYCTIKDNTEITFFVDIDNIEIHLFGEGGSGGDGYTSDSGVISGGGGGAGGVYKPVSLSVKAGQTLGFQIGMNSEDGNGKETSVGSYSAAGGKKGKSFSETNGTINYPFGGVSPYDEGNYSGGNGGIGFFYSTLDPSLPNPNEIIEKNPQYSLYGADNSQTFDWFNGKKIRLGGGGNGGLVEPLQTNSFSGLYGIGANNDNKNAFPPLDNYSAGGAGGEGSNDLEGGKGALL